MEGMLYCKRCNYGSTTVQSYVECKLCWDYYYLPSLSLGFDAGQVFYSDNFGGEQDGGQGSLANNLAVKKRFREFLRQFHDGGHTAFTYKYRYFLVTIL